MPPLLISLTFCISTLLDDLYAPVPTPASSKFHSISARQKVIVLSLTLVLLSRTHCHCYSLLAGFPQSLVSKLQTVHNSAASLVVRALPHVHITPILKHLRWLPVRARIFYKTAWLCFNAITSSNPAYLSDLLHLYSPSRSLRSSADTRFLKIPLYKCKTKGDRAFSYFGPSVWNSLPLHIRNATTINTPQVCSKNYLFNLQESD